MYNTFNPEQSQDGDDEMRRLHVECEEPVRVSAVLCGSEGGAGSDVEKSEHMLTPFIKLQQFHSRVVDEQFHKVSSIPTEQRH